MKRPLAAFGLIYLSASAVAVCFALGINLTFAIMAALITGAACFFASDKRRDVLIIAIPIILAFSVITVCQYQAEQLSAVLSTNTCAITGEVADIPRRQYGRWYYVVKTDSVGIEGVQQHIRIRLTCRNSMEAKEGDHIACTATFIQNDTENGYNSVTSLRADSISARAWCSPYAEQNVTHPKGTSIRYWPLRLRRSIISAVQKALPQPSSGMLCAMLLGDTDYLDDDVIDHFRATGLSHLLAVSGLHMSLLTYAVTQLLKKIRLRPKTVTVATMGFVLFFMAVTGFSPSVTRAGIMHLMTLLSSLILRDADSPTSMSLSVLLMCAINPWSAADIGLQMSVCSTLGLLMLGSRMKQIRRKHKSSVGRNRLASQIQTGLIHAALTASTAALVTMPLTAVYFGRFSIASPLTNLLCVSAATAFIFLGVIAAALYAIPLIGGLISFPFRLSAVILSAYLDVVTGRIARFPLASVNMSYAYVPWFFFFALLLLICAAAAVRNIRKPEFTRRVTAFVCWELSVLLLTAMLSHALTCTGAEITVFAMQDGGVCVCAKNRTHAIIAEAGGDKYDMRCVEDTLNTQGIQKIDALSVSDNSRQRSAIASHLIDALAPEYVFCGGDLRSFSPIYKAALRGGSPPNAFGGRVTLNYPSLSLEMFTDSGGGKWQLLRSGKLSVLICPDNGDCALLPAPFLQCDAVVLGGKVKNLSNLTAGAAIITAEFEDAALIAYELQAKGFRYIYITERDGSIRCTVNGERLSIKTAYPHNKRL